MEQLLCTGCGRTFPIDAHRARCSDCGEPLEVDGRTVGGADVGARIGGRIGDTEIGTDVADTEAADSRLSGDVPPRPSAEPLLLRFADFLPKDALGLRHHRGLSDVLTLGEGDTPLLSLGAIGESIGLPGLYVKVEGANPTGSFKDRGSVAGVQRARAAGFSRVGTVSTGNMAGSVAAYAARAGMEAVVLVSASIPPAKLAPIAAYGPRLIGVEGDYGALYDVTMELGPKLGIAFINSDDPWRVEGQKTLALELWLQFGRIVPDVVIVPVSSGGHMAGLLKGFEELVSRGLAGRVPRLVGVQAAGCAPIASAFARGESVARPWGAVDTVAKAIANATPPSGRRLLRAVGRGARLHFTTVTDEQLLTAYRELTVEAGIFAQHDAAATVAAAKRLRSEEYLDGTETVVAILTGHGTKDLTPIVGGDLRLETCTLARLESLLRG